jgi:hypothetical protein
MDHGQEVKKSTAEGSKRTCQDKPKKPIEAKVALANADTTEKVPLGPRKCRFEGSLGCMGAHPPWMCKALSDKAPEERNLIIEDNKMCPFCLLHNAEIRTVPKCKGLHIQRLHQMLLSGGNAGSMNIIQDCGGWRMPDEAWMDLDVAEEEMYFINMVMTEPEMEEEADSLEAEYEACTERREATRMKRGHPQYISNEEESIL